MRSGSVSSPALFFLNTALNIIDDLHFPICFRMSLSISIKKRERKTWWHYIESVSEFRTVAVLIAKFIESRS